MARLHAGLDVASKNTAICIVDTSGATILEAEAETSATAIAEVLKPFRKSLVSVGLESGTHADRLHKQLSKSKYPMKCLDARRAHAMLSTRVNKTDANDARGLALLLAGGIYTLAHVKGDEATVMRHVLLLRDGIVLRAADLRRTAKASRRSLEADQHGKMASALGVMDAAIVALDQQRDAMDKVVGELVGESPVCRRLTTIPGIGPIAALAFVAAVDDPYRFKSSRTVAAYFGLTPRTYQSGESTRTGGISRMGDRRVRTALYTAAMSLLSRSKSNCALRRWGLRIVENKGYRRACVAVSRKLAVLMHHLWVTNQDFDPAR